VLATAFKESCIDSPVVDEAICGLGEAEGETDEEMEREAEEERDRDGLIEADAEELTDLLGEDETLLDTLDDALILCIANLGL
jgi:hypothetical protein